jgi:hypothetical protein
VLASLSFIALLVVAGIALSGAHRVLDDGAVRVAGVAAVAGVGVLVVLAVVAVGLGGRAAGPDDGDDDPPANQEEAADDDAPGAAPLRQPSVALRAVGPHGLPPVPGAVGDLRDGGSLVLRVDGLDAGSVATVHQCPAGTLAARSCRPGLPFTVGDDRRSTVLVDLEDRFDVDGETVDCIRVDCSIVVFGTSRLEVLTVFGRPAPPSVTIAVDPGTLPPGGTLTVMAEHLRAGSETSFVVCRPDGDRSADCGEPTRAVVAGVDGRVRGAVTVGSGRCPRGARCAIGVIVDGSGPRAYAPLHLIGRGGVAYDDARLVTGMALGGVLLLVALVLLRRTDWTPVEGDPFAGVTLPDDPFADVVDR